MNILMPQLGETVSEGTITVWHKSVGDLVAPGDGLFEIETDKTSMEVPATTAGVLSEIRTAAGVTVPIGSIVAVITSEQRAPEATQAAAGPPKATLDPFNSVRTPERNFGPASLPSGVKVTPVARRIAAQTGVDLEKLTGSGPHGRIVAKDVKAGAKGADAAPESIKAAAIAALPSAEQVKAMYGDVPFEEVPLDGMRRTIAKRLLESKLSIPHFYLAVEISLDRLTSARAEINAQCAGRFKLSVNDFVIKAAAVALQRVPEANAAWAEDRILRFRRSDVSVAVAVEGGLFTPVIRQAESKSMSAISSEMKELVQRAQAKTLKATDYQGGSITISNLGMYGVSSFTAIVNPPQAAILAIGAAQRRPFERADGSVQFGSFMTVTLSCDHRVIDGALGSRFLAAFKQLMEAPLALLA